MSEVKPYHDEILSLLRQANCHYGAALRDEDDGLSAEQAARKREEVRVDRIVDLRRAVHMAADGEHARNKAQAGTRTGCCAHCCTLKAKCPMGFADISSPASRNCSRSLVSAGPLPRYAA